ncbi:MAG: rhodanese-like domain-containing protein [Betaproteobacteria bacterium]|nr:rhodanese-like domain-containing protein [Betaproteobacteria bacterium]
MKGFQIIDAARLRALLQEARVQLVDVRTEAEVARGRIDGAIHIPLHLLPSRVAELDTDTPAVFYCHSGMRSAQACTYLAGLGFDKLYNLLGGILAWVDSGHPLGRAA